MVARNFYHIFDVFLLEVLADGFMQRLRKPLASQDVFNEIVETPEAI